MFNQQLNARKSLIVVNFDIISSYGARKGLVDTALRTADSGYLTRRLVDVSQDVIIREIDCGTDRGIPISSMTEGDKTLIPLATRLMGRVIGENVVHPRLKELIAQRNTPVTEELGRRIESSGVTTVVVRSPLTCEAARSVCQHCYGWSLAQVYILTDVSVMALLSS